MEAEDLVVDFCSNRQALEDFRKQFPYQISTIFPQTLVVESVELVDLPVLVVPSQKRDPMPVLDLQQQHVEESFHRVEPSIHVVSHEKVVCVLGKEGSTGSFPQI